MACHSISGSGVDQPRYAGNSTAQSLNRYVPLETGHDDVAQTIGPQTDAG